MNRGVYELGRLFRAARVEKRLTQNELAAEIGTTRSAIALMEQGRRLLSAADLRRIQQCLSVPPALVEPFLLPALQRHRHRTSRYSAGPPPFSLAVVSGISGSGKTTLSRALEKTFGAAVVGSSPHGKSYISDLSKNSERWASEAQAAFIVGKIHSLHQALSSGSPVVSERWYTEDTDIYAQMFHELGSVDDRAMETLRALRSVGEALLPQPQYIFMCRCSPETAATRIGSRGRDDSHLQSIDHLRLSHDLYEEWFENQIGPELYRIDTDINDLSQPGVLEAIVSEIAYISSNRIRDPQMSLFGGSTSDVTQLRRLIPVNMHKWSEVPKQTGIDPLSVSPRVAPTAYLAAPFTGMDSSVSPESDTTGRLFPDERPHGIIPAGRYRSALLRVERFLAERSFSVLLPHRDVNNWGRKTLTPQQAMKQCTMHVDACDLFVGFLGSSNGAHYEFGLALASGKPCILINGAFPESSFLASGADSITSEDLLVLTCGSIEEAADVLRSSSLPNDFLARHFGRLPEEAT